MRRTKQKNYVISRQLSWPDGIYYVELETGGEDSTSPGMMGSCKTFGDPRDATTALITMRNNWQAEFVPNEGEDDPQTTILVSIGTTGGGMFSHDPSELTDEQIKEWADKEYEKLPKCDRCGDVIDEKYTIFDDPDAGDFCSENCANLEIDWRAKEEEDSDD
jgi:hypothetical protein